MFICITIEDEYGNTPAQRAEFDWLLYSKPLEYAQLVLGGEIEHYLSLGCDHGRLEDGRIFSVHLQGVIHGSSNVSLCGIVSAPCFTVSF